MTVSVSQFVIGGLIVIGFFGSFIALLLRPDMLTEINKEPVMLMVGALVAAFATLIGFFFGSSAGSARKTDLLAKKTNEPIELTNEIKP
jgi:hypothetical protein